MNGFDKRMGDQGFVGWLARPASNLGVAVLFTLLCLLFGLFAFEFEERGNQISGIQHSACVIQARGLPAGHDLAAAMGEIHSLLTLPRAAGSAPTPAPVESILSALNANLAAYTALEAKQPSHRKCS